MKVFYYLKSCDTCQRILTSLQLPIEVERREIKSLALTAEELDAMQVLSGTYEALFSKRSRLYQQRGLKNLTLSENEIKDLLLEHYTFLKRPVLIWEEYIFVGNSKNTIDAAYELIHG
ncbi:MAG: hypothetical protein CBC80_002510 [Flavobacteriaceae bacterium TMED120]|jgi:arsenate reductase|nr:MAG: hypothetical protein CBC80_002510 [Flavobacteriaceae bacterium TMED120]|tara:strand:+ start:3265 stop:3618 length:354 start_codon:yes stop_codon:yes gene_type:complete